MHTSTQGSQKKVVFLLQRGGCEDEQGSEGVYARLRQRLLEQIPAPGKLLHIGALAQEFGVSSTPVREALTRLAAQRLVAFTPNKGFFTKTPSQVELHDLYCLSEVLLQAAISRWPKRAETCDEPVWHHDASIQHVPTGRVCGHDARLTAELFVRIASRSTIQEYRWLMSNVNDRLHHARLVEAAIVADACEELNRLVSLYTSARRGELKAALKAYHEKRDRLVSALCKELLARSFLRAGRCTHNP